MSDHEYSQGIMGDGATILKDGQPMTVEEIVSTLTTAQTECVAQLAMVAELVGALEEIVKQYPNPNISHENFRVHACRHAESVLSAYRKGGE